MPRISPARTSRSTPWTTSRPRSSLTDQSFDPEHRAGRVRFAAIDGERDLAADHQLGEVLLVRLGRDPLADDLAAPDDRDPVGDLEDLVELVADEDDAVALGREAAQDLEDLLGLLRCQDGGRLVEDEDLGVAVERLEDLDPLLPADGQGADLDVGVDLEAEPSTEFDDPAIGLVAVEEDRIGHRLLAEDDVLGDGQDRDEHEVLVDHADPAGDRVRGTGQVDLGAIEQDRALVGRGQPVEDVHQGGLAGAVLAEQRVDLARPDVEIDVVVGDDARIPLRDAAHLERGCLDHRNVDVRDLGRGASLVIGQSSLTRLGYEERADRRSADPLAERSGSSYRSARPGVWPHFAGQVVSGALLHAGEGLVELGLGVGRELALRLVERRDADAVVRRR